MAKLISREGAGAEPGPSDFAEVRQERGSGSAPARSTP